MSTASRGRIVYAECHHIIGGLCPDCVTEVIAAVRSEALEEAARAAEDTSAPRWSYAGEVTAAVAARIRSLGRGEGGR